MKVEYSMGKIVTSAVILVKDLLNWIVYSVPLKVGCYSEIINAYVGISMKK